MSKSVVKPFSYNPDKHPEVAAWIAALPPDANVSAAIRALIVAAAHPPDPTALLLEIRDAVRDLQARRAAGPADPDLPGTADLPADVRAALDGLAEL